MLHFQLIGVKNTRNSLKGNNQPKKRMAEITSPKSETETTAVEDPLVDSTRTEAEPAVAEPEIDLAHVVSATPVAMYKPGDAEVTPLTGSQRRRSSSSMEEASRRPEWLPDDWKMETRRRNSGKSAGEFDRYFFSPTGKRLRSKNEVMRFLAAQAASNANTNSVSGEEPPAESPEQRGRKKQKVESRMPNSEDGATSKETTEVS